MRLRLATCLDPNLPGSAGIWDKAFDALKPEKGSSPLDSLKRKLARQRFLRELRPAQGAPMDHVLPEIRPDRRIGTLALMVPAQYINSFVEKLVRGTVYITERRYIEPTQEITVSLLKLGDDGEVLQLLEQFGELYERGPGIRIRKAVAHEARTNALFVFDVWDHFRFYGAVMDRAVMQE